MSKLTKRRKLVIRSVQFKRAYPVLEAITLAKVCSTVKFRESLDVAVNLCPDFRQSGQIVLGSTVLPHGIGRNIRVAVFACQDDENKARRAGADIVGTEALTEQILSGNIDFDLMIATPETMQMVGKLGRILGPRGLMPNPKDGTVTTDITTAVKRAKQGQVRYRSDKNGIIHCSIGKVDFTENALEENLSVLLSDIKAKCIQRSNKAFYLKKLTLSTTMGPGIAIELTTLKFF
ncbi:50S ribosomal protein L1 [Coxiella endosymbiont of Amblyomma americanum]|uniref:50S ribosomal protein L1 n=1 Tax=Coxiella endosymbiont of Amblyomma americanum TaxID=325775 RepID=UPI00057D7B09|nr:50S ribosomal protein L1 [Coxiella endosymbiont of Amblyomma americanum]